MATKRPSFLKRQKEQRRIERALLKREARRGKKEPRPGERIPPPFPSWPPSDSTKDAPADQDEDS